MYSHQRQSRTHNPWWDTAQICINGHVINILAVDQKDRNAPFCRDCGARTIMACEHCATAIRGMRHYDMGARPFAVPMNCENCGAQFPWTESAIAAAHELVAEFELSAEDKATLDQDVVLLVEDSARTQVAALRTQRILSKAGSGAMEIFVQVLSGVLTEVAKGVLLPH